MSDDTRSPSDLKVALVYKLAKFVEWPEEAFEDASAPIVFGVLGAPEVWESASRLLEESFVGDRRVEVRELERLSDDLRDVHVLFVGRDIPETPEAVADASGDGPVLSIGETPRFAHRGGIVNLYYRGGALRFEINPDRAVRRNLRISAKLLALARIVDDE
jgi:hypothetical protein